MIIKSLSGKTLYQSNHRTMKAALEDGIEQDVDFAGGDFRSARLSGGNFDGLKAKGASFWGADLHCADIGLADLREADFRCADLQDACFAQTILTGADLRGAYFSRTIVEDAVLDGIKASCPSFWTLDFASAASFENTLFYHLGEQEMTLTDIPLTIRGKGPHLALSGNHCVWGQDLYTDGPMSPLLESRLLELKITLEKLLKRNFSHSAIKPIPKRAGQGVCS